MSEYQEKHEVTIISKYHTRKRYTEKVGQQLPYSGFLSREKTIFANCLKIDFRRENFREFAVTQCTTPTNVVSNYLKIDFRRENFHESPQKREIRESFLPRKKPAMRYNWRNSLKCKVPSLLLNLTVLKTENYDTMFN